MLQRKQKGGSLWSCKAWQRWTWRPSSSWICL